MLTIPAPYYLERGYRAETLQKFEVGLVTEPRSRVHGRTFYPVYDAYGTTIIGGVARSCDPLCASCRLCHPAQGPCPGVERYRVIGKFVDKHHLYNQHHAYNHIKTHRTVILVEGAGDVWRLDEAGIHHAVALFGCELTDPQKIQIECLPGHRVLICLDDDRAGRQATATIAAQIRSKDVITLTPTRKDPGDMTPAELRTLFKDYL
jgi:5S rRNA maturation endonuclease (ribonuclease M5)